MSNPKRTQSETSSSIHQSSDLLEYHRLHMEMTLNMEKMRMEMEAMRHKEQLEMAKGLFSMIQLGFGEVMKRIDRDQDRMQARLELEREEMEMEKQRRAENKDSEEWENKYWELRAEREKKAEDWEKKYREMRRVNEGLERQLGLDDYIVDED